MQTFLQQALRVSMEEQRAHQEEEARKAATASIIDAGGKTVEGILKKLNIASINE